MGLINSLRIITERANQGSAYTMLHDTLEGRVPAGMEALFFSDALLRAYYSILDNVFFIYLDGSIAVGYHNTGFKLAEDCHGDMYIHHPESGHLFYLPQPRYDLAYGQTEGALTGRTQFCHDLFEMAFKYLSSENH
jgi:hypothetical protein